MVIRTSDPFDTFFHIISLPVLASLIVLGLNELEGHVPRHHITGSGIAASALGSDEEFIAFADPHQPYEAASIEPPDDSLPVHLAPSEPRPDVISGLLLTSDPEDGYDEEEEEANSDQDSSKMVADALIYHPTVAHYLKFVATTTGRDKLLRTLQYFARFYSWYLLRTNGTKAEIAPWDVMKKQFGLTRKLMRVGKNIEHIKAAAVAADSKSMDPVLRYTAIGRQLGYAGYLSLDMATVLNATGIKTWEGAKRAQQEAYRFWTMGLLCSVVAQLYTLYNLGERAKTVDKKDGEGVVESKRIAKERAASQLQLLSDLCDLPAPTQALGWVGFDDGFVGLAGTVSSLIGIYSQWKKTA